MPVDSETYIHPIIQAMIASADSKDRALSLAQKDATDKEQADFRKKQLAETVKRAEDEHNLNLQNFDLRKQEYDLQQQHMMHLMKHGVLEDIGSGLQPVAGLPSAPTIPTALNSQPGNPSQTATPSPQSVAPTPNFSQMPAPGPQDSQDGNVDVGGTSMPRAVVAQIPASVAAQKGATARAIAEAQDQAKLPNQAAAQKAVLDRVTAQEDQRHRDHQEDLTMQQSFLEHQKALDRQNYLDRVAATKAGLQHGVDPEDVHSLADDASTGDADLTGSTKAVLAARTALQEAGRKEFGTKAAAALKQAETLQNWIDKLRNFANTRPTSKIGAAVSGALDNNPLIKTDARTEYDTIQTGLISAGKALEGISGGRITIPQMKKLEEGAASLYTTKANALKLADNLQSMLHQQVDTNLLGGIGETQRQLIFHKQGVTPERLGLTGSPTTATQLPDFLKVAPPKNKRGTALNVNESIKAGQPVYGGN